MRDYAKKKISNKRHRFPQNDRWLIIFIIITLCLAGISALNTLYHKLVKEKQMVTKTQTAPMTPIEKKFKKAAPQSIEPATPEPKYDFYQLLPKMTVDVPASNDQTPDHPLK